MYTFNTFYFEHKNFYLISHCCCTPITDPGRHIRVHAIASTAVNDQCFTIYEATKQPVLPNPAENNNREAKKKTN